MTQGAWTGSGVDCANLALSPGGGTTYGTFGSCNHIGPNRTTESQAQQTNRGAMTLQNFGCYVGTNSITGGTWSLTTRVATAAGNQSVSLSSTGYFSDSTHTDSVADGTLFDYSSVPGGSGGSADLGGVTAQIALNSQCFCYLTCFGGSVNDSGATAFIALAGTYLPTATRGNTQISVMESATFSHLQAQVISSHAASACTLEVGGTSVNETIATTSSGFIEDTTHTDSVSSGNLVDVTMTGGSTTTPRMSFVSIKYASTTAGRSVMYTGGTTVAGTGATAFWPMGGNTSTNATESNTEYPCPVAGTGSLLQVRITANTIGTAQTWQLRKNAANANQSASITASTTGVFQDATHTDATVSGDRLDCSTASTFTSSATLASFGMVFLGPNSVTYTQTLSATQSQADGLVKNLTRLFGATAPQTDGLVKTPTRLLHASAPSAAALVKSPTRLLSVSASQAASLLKALIRILSASAPSAPNLLKLLTRLFSASAPSAATLVKNPTRILSAAQPSHAALVWVRQRLVTLSASAPQSAALVKAITRILSASAPSSASLQHALTRILSAGQSSSASVVRAITRILKASQSQSASVTTAKFKNVTLSASAPQAAGLVKALTRLLGVSAPSSSGLVRALQRRFSASAPAVAGLQRALTRFLGAAQPQSAALTKADTRVLSAAAPSSAGLRKALIRLLSAGAPTVASLQKGVTRILSAAAPQVAGLQRVSARVLSASVTPIGGLVKSLVRILSAAQPSAARAIRSRIVTLGTTQPQSDALTKTDTKVLSAQQPQVAGLSMLISALRLMSVFMRGRRKPLAD